MNFRLAILFSVYYSVYTFNNNEERDPKIYSIPNMGTILESSGTMYVHNGYIHHSIIIGLPSHVQLTRLIPGCNDIEFLEPEYLKALEESYQGQLNSLRDDIPVSSWNQDRQTSNDKGTDNTKATKKYGISVDSPSPIYNNIGLDYKERINIENENSRIKSTRLNIRKSIIRIPREEHTSERSIKQVSDNPREEQMIEQPFWRYHKWNFTDEKLSRTKRSNSKNLTDITTGMGISKDDTRRPIIKRQRRELITMAVAGAIVLIGSAVAFAISSKIDSATIEQHMDLVDNRLNEIGVIVNKLGIDQQDMVHRLNNITSITLPSIYQDIKRLSQEIHCTKSSSLMFMISAISWLSTIPSKIYRIMGTAYTGKITPDIFPRHLIEKMIQEREDLSNSPYLDNPSLIYEVGTFVIIQVKHNPFLLQGLLIIPNIHSTSLHELYRSHQVNFMYNHYGLKNSILRIPDVIAKDKYSKTFWNVNRDKCSFGIRYAICPSDVATSSINKCVTELINHDNSSYCTIVEMSPKDHIITLTSLGLYLGTSNNSYRVITYDGKPSPTVKTYQNIPNPTLIEGQTGRHVEVEDNVYNLSPSHSTMNLTDYVMTVNITDNSTEYGIPASIPYVPLVVPQDYKLEEIHHMMHITHYLSHGLLLLLIIMSMYVVYRKSITKKYTPNQYKIKYNRGKHTSVIIPIEEIEESYMEQLTETT